jgi:predicted enzyme related to lactoylglutathione lyase
MHIAVVLDCADPERLARFWAEALGYRQQRLEEPYLMLLPAQRGAGPVLALQRVPEPKVGKNRMHIDLHVEDVEGEVARLVALGATRRSGALVEVGFRWVVLGDPEGNEFCVVGRSGG